MALALKADHFRIRRRPSLPAHYVENGIALDATVSASSAHHDRVGAENAEVRCLALASGSHRL
jgi:hypothetical protein